MSDCIPDAYGVNTRKARKNHKCCECRGLIKAGESYFYHHGVWDGQGRSFKMCPECNQLMIDINKNAVYPDDSVSFEELYLHAVESMDWLKRYIDIKEKRGAIPIRWMIDKYEKSKLQSTSR